MTDKKREVIDLTDDDDDSNDGRDHDNPSAPPAKRVCIRNDDDDDDGSNDGSDDGSDDGSEDGSEDGSDDDDELAQFDDDDNDDYDYEDDYEDDDDQDVCDCGDCDDCDAAYVDADRTLHADADADDNDDMMDVINDVIDAKTELDTPMQVCKWYARLVRVWTRLDETSNDEDDDEYDDEYDDEDYNEADERLRAALRHVLLARPSFLLHALTNHMNRTSKDPCAIGVEDQRYGLAPAVWGTAHAYLIELLFDDTTPTSLRSRLTTRGLDNKAEKLAHLCATLSTYVCSPPLIRYAEIIVAEVADYHSAYPAFQKMFFYFVLLPFDNLTYRYGNSGCGRAIARPTPLVAVDLRVALPLSTAYADTHALFAPSKEAEWRNFDYFHALQNRAYNWSKWREMPVLIRRALVEICHYPKPCHHVGPTCCPANLVEPLWFSNNKEEYQKQQTDYYKKKAEEDDKRARTDGCKRLLNEECLGNKCAAARLCDCPFDAFATPPDHITMDDIRNPTLSIFGF